MCSTGDAEEELDEVARPNRALRISSRIRNADFGLEEPTDGVGDMEVDVSPLSRSSASGGRGKVRDSSLCLITEEQMSLERTEVWAVFSPEAVGVVRRDEAFEYSGVDVSEEVRWIAASRCFTTDLWPRLRMDGLGVRPVGEGGGGRPSAPKGRRGVVGVVGVVGRLVENGEIGGATGSREGRVGDLTGVEVSVE